MSVDFQDEFSEDWDMAGAMSESCMDDNAEMIAPKYSSLNEALEEAGSVMGDLRGNLPIAFRFIWHKMTVFCEIAAGDGDIMLIMDTDLGPLPFTIENKARRDYLQQLIDPLIELPIGEFTITERRRFRHRVIQPLAEPITGSSIVTAVAQSLLTGRPYHQLAKAV